MASRNYELAKRLRAARWPAGHRIFTSGHPELAAGPVRCSDPTLLEALERLGGHEELRAWCEDVCAGKDAWRAAASRVARLSYTLSAEDS